MLLSHALTVTCHNAAAQVPCHCSNSAASAAHQSCIWQLVTMQLLLHFQWPLLHQGLHIWHGITDVYIAAWLGLHSQWQCLSCTLDSSTQGRCKATAGVPYKQTCLFAASGDRCRGHFCKEFHLRAVLSVMLRECNEAFKGSGGHVRLSLLEFKDSCMPDRQVCSASTRVP